MSASAYLATVRLDNSMYLPAVFIVGENPDDRYALGKVLDDTEYDWLGDYAYWELHPDQWFVVKHGQNIGLGFMLDTEEPITKMDIHPWQYATANKENN